MEAQKENQDDRVVSALLLELAALDDVDSFKRVAEARISRIDEFGDWYGRRIGSKKMSYERRTPLMIAALYGSVKVVEYIITSGKAEVNRVAGSDRVSALHCAVAGGSDSSSGIVHLLLRASADPNIVDGNGNKPSNLIPRTPNLPCKKLNLLLAGDEGGAALAGQGGAEIVSLLRKEYPVDASLPDINNGIYSTDEFRMYSFKITPCSRAYTHDWTECPFAHPGENARRRDPRKFQYSCVPCPEFKKGNCKNGDNCEYAHGVFESWLHPAQYRTRLCKDETGCARKVCFFAHKKEELRPVYAATGSALPSPTPMSPTSSPKWQGRVSNSPPAPPTLQLAGSRLRSSLNARDLELEIELLKLGNQINQAQQQQMQWDMNPNPNPSGSFMDSQLAQLDHLRSSYQLSSPVRKLSPNSSPPKSVAAAMLNSRAAAFTQRSQSFIDRGAAMGSFSTGASFSPSSMAPSLSNWGSPEGKLDWGIQGEELSKLRKSASFGFRGSNGLKKTTVAPMIGFANDEPDVSWVNSLVKDVPAGHQSRKQQYSSVNGVHEIRTPWMEQLYIEQEQMVA